MLRSLKLIPILARLDVAIGPAFVIMLSLSLPQVALLNTLSVLLAYHPPLSTISVTFLQLLSFLSSKYDSIFTAWLLFMLYITTFQPTHLSRIELVAFCTPLASVYLPVCHISFFHTTVPST